MSKNNLNNLINLIQETAKIEEIIGDYVNLERKGGNYFGLCPFHQDSNPSMSVSPTKKIFKCFSCGAAGNVMNFVQNFEGISFIDTLKKLSEKLNIDWKEYISQKNFKQISEETKLLWKINQESINFYKFNLENELNSNNSSVKKYLEKREITQKEIFTYGLGFAKPGISLFNYLVKKGYKEIDILKTGLIKETKEGYQDYFYNRLMFSLHDQNGNPIGFSGRIIGENNKYAKYINTPDTKLFRKGNNLYNYHRARSPISLNKFTYLLEGYMDVISLSKIDINNAIASMGTAFTEYQLKLLTSITKNIIIAMDSDDAGVTATIKLGEELLKHQIDSIYVVENKETKDIDELVRKFNDNIKFQKYIKKNTIEFLEFYFNIVTKNENPNFDNIEKFVSVLCDVKIPKASYYINKIASRYSFDPKTYLEKQEKEWNRKYSNISNSNLDLYKNKSNHNIDHNIEKMNVQNSKVYYAEDNHEIVISNDETTLNEEISQGERKIISIIKDSPILMRHFDKTDYVFKNEKINNIYWAIASWCNKSCEKFDLNDILIKINDKYKEYARDLFNIDNKQTIEENISIMDEMISKLLDLRNKEKLKEIENKINNSSNMKEKMELFDTMSKIK